MPRDNSGLFYYTPGTEAEPLEPASSGDVNSRFDAVRDDLNAPVPLSRGGTGAGNASGARDSFSVYSKAETNGLFVDPSKNGTIKTDAIGSLIFAVNKTNSTVSYGTAVSGSKIQPTGVTGQGGLTSIPGPARSGEWISLGQAFPDHATLFVKRSM